MLAPGSRSVERADWEQVLRSDPCSYCGGQGGTIDHVVPRASRGANAMTNLAGACQSCNGRKGLRTLLHFLLGLPYGDPMPKKTRRPIHLPECSPMIGVAGCVDRCPVRASELRMA